jgi:ubiquinone/menaquinone biosynthesis C-methylase UbiE
MTANKRVDYNAIASKYGRNNQTSTLSGITRALRFLAQESPSGRLLEVGCGTGLWLAALSELVSPVYGLDLSLGMLRQTMAREVEAGSALLLCNGQASRLPFYANSFNLIYCVNALHHFLQPERFIMEAHRVLKPGGALAIVGLNPHDPGINWYIYDYFDGTYEADLARFPSVEDIVSWMAAADFVDVQSWTAHQVVHTYFGRQVLDSPFIRKTGTSQLALLSDEDYTSGLARVEATIQAAGKEALFEETLPMPIVAGHHS